MLIRKKRQQKYKWPLVGCFKAIRLCFYMENTKKGRQVVRGQYVEGSKIRKTGRKGKKPKLGESKT